MLGLLDTAVVVDILRNYPDALAWLGQQGQLGVTRIVWLEILEGAQSRQKQEEAIKLLRRFEVVDLTPSDWIWATEQLLRFRLERNVDAFDALIASASYRLQIPLYTTNEKHFMPMLGKLAQTPY